MPFTGQPGNNPSLIGSSKFNIPIQQGTIPSSSNGPRPNLVTRVIKKLKQKIKKYAHFTVFHTGLQPSVQVVRLVTRRVYRKKSSFQLRKIARFFNWHSGLQRVVESQIKFQTRIRKTLKKASFPLRKLARFTYWHTGLQPSVQVIKFQTRVRKTLKKANFQFRKIALFTKWHVTFVQPDINHNVLKLAARRSLRDKRRKGKNARFFPLYETGLQPVSLFLRMRTRRSIRSKSAYQYRKIAHVVVWHFTPAAGGGTRREWVSPRTGHSRGDQ
jgi:hypothetical protein